MQLAEGLAAKGIDVCLATFGRAGSALQKSQAAAISGLKWWDSSLKLEWMDEPWSDVERSGPWLLDLERQFHPDVIHLNTLCHGALGWQAPVVTTVHSCVTSWWAAVKGTPLPDNWSCYRREVEHSLKCSTLVTAPSRAMLASVSENYDVNPAISRVIGNGRRAAQFRAEPKEPFILSAGRFWDEAKNVQALVEIAPKLPWPVFLAGEQESPDGRTASLAGCHVLGPLSTPELASWYARAAIYALPARYEPFGLSVLEAALSGCALVLGDIPSLREAWQDSAIFVPPNNIDHLQAALRTLIEDPQQRQAMSASARKRAQLYSESLTVSKYLEAYDWALRHTPRRRHACAS